MDRYRGSDGRWYPAIEVWDRVERGTWDICMWEEDTGRELVETESGVLLMLTPADTAPASASGPGELPER